MADVEVKLDIKAEAKAALAAVEALGKKLDELQSKSRLLVGGGGDESGGGSDRPGAGGSAAGAGAAGDVAVPVVDLSGQQAAVEGFRKALESVREQVAAVGAVLQELAGQPSVPTDGAAQVAALADVYRQLAEAVGAVNEAVGAMPVPVMPTVDVPTAGGDVAPQDDGHGLVGAENYLEKLEEEKRVVEELREELRLLNAAHEEAGEAAGEAQDDEEELAYQMELAQMNAQELAQEIERLTEARKASAKAGDAVAMQRYGKQLQLANKEMQRSRREQTIMRAAWLQQAQGAREAAQSIKNVVGGFSNLSENAKNGQLDLVGLGMEVFSLAKAFKGLLGPVGLALVAIELLTSVWNEYQQKKQHGVELAQEKLKKDAEDLKKATEAYREATEAYRDEKAKEYEEYNKNLLDNIRAEAELGEQRAERANQLLAAETAHREKMLRVQLQNAVGADKERLQRELENISLATEERKKQDAEAAAAAAEERLAAMEKALAGDKYADLLAIKLPDVEELKQLEVRLDSAMRHIGEALGEEEKAALRKQVASIRREMREVAATVRGVDENIHGSDKEVVEWVRSLQEARRNSEQVVEQQRKTLEAKRHEAELAVQGYAWRRQELAAERAAAERKKQADDAAAARAEEWEKVKGRSLAEQVRWLKAQLRNTELSAKEQERIRRDLQAVQSKQLSEAMAQLLKETQTTGNYQVSDNRTRRQIMQADAALLVARRAELESLRRSAGVDPALRAQIDAELKQTRAQIAGLAEAWGRNRRESYKWLSELQPPQLKAKNAMVQRNLDAMAQGYARAARKAVEAAREGDADGLRAARRSMLSYAKAMSRMSEDSTAAQRLYRQHTEGVREVARRSAVSAAEERKAAEAGRRKAAAADRAAKAAEDEAAKAEQQEVQIADLSAEVGQLKEALGKTSAAHGLLAGEVTKLATAAEVTAQKATEAAGVTAQAVAALGYSIKGLQQQVDKLRKAVDGLSRSAGKKG